MSKKVIGMKLISIGVYKFDVDDEDDNYVVNLQTKVCVCCNWILMGISYAYVMGCINKRKMDDEEFVHEDYYVLSYAATDKSTFHGVPGNKQ